MGFKAWDFELQVPESLRKRFYVYTYIYMHVRLHACMYVCMFVCTYVRMYVCTYVCTYVCMQCLAVGLKTWVGEDVK